MLLAACMAAAPAAASARPGVADAVWTVHGHGASASASINVLTLNDQRKIDNRITAYLGSDGRLVLTAPEGLGDPDGSGVNCRLDNAKSGETSATEVSCAAGYIGAIVGDLGGGSDTFDADPDLSVMVGGVIDGQSRPLFGGPGRDRLVGGALNDLLMGGGGSDSLVGGRRERPPRRGRRPGQADRGLRAGTPVAAQAAWTSPRAASSLAEFRSTHR